MSLQTPPSLTPSSGAQSFAAAWDAILGIRQATTVHHRTVKPATEVPLVIISGFLGSGKTTLLNSLLAQDHGRRVAVLVNDFGAIDIDGGLVQSRGSRSISLRNGCVCCSVATGMIGVLSDLVTSNDPPDVILLENSGIAEPHPVVQTALTIPGVRLSAVVTVVDVEALGRPSTAYIRNLILRQASAADIIVANKVDLVDDRTLHAMRSWLQSVAPRARRVETQHSHVPASLIIGHIGAPIASETQSPIDATEHADKFDTFVLSEAARLDHAQLCRFAGDLPDAVLRVKGRVSYVTPSGDQDGVLHVVGPRWHIEPCQLDGAERSELVVIAQAGAVDEADLRQAFAACAYDRTSSMQRRLE